MAVQGMQGKEDRLAGYALIVRILDNGGEIVVADIVNKLLGRGNDEAVYQMIADLKAKGYQADQPPHSKGCSGRAWPWKADAGLWSQARPWSSGVW